ncbi:hypothetical protein HRG_009539 [Hirsutella rhossiliensis]|uniref:Uncharacterized protein n=1 Tax=Hirsutella rhossiliensis TaxID=111463 RepID=A0A9P8MP31_9HYPO|nr:uncharacterized protein HRG_09539 [Hirsutella rhossiliensis]KAH0959078.1 hypothetical protein HRG_09539 [Hirsutella rhossiliensis]
MQQSVVYKFLGDVAMLSPTTMVSPITILYSFPGVTSGVDPDSNLVIGLAATNAKAVGYNLTCGDASLRSSHRARLCDFFHLSVLGQPGLPPARLYVAAVVLYDQAKLKEAIEIQTRLTEWTGPLAGWAWCT